MPEKEAIENVVDELLDRSEGTQVLLMEENI
jgi:hypothetical protein